MTRTTPRPLLAAAALALGIALAGCAGAGDTSDLLPTADDVGADTGDQPTTSGMCVEGEPDCEDTVAIDDGAGGAAGSCLAGDEGCTDESYGGEDVSRPVPFVQDIQEETTAAARGATSGASGAVIEQAALVDADTVRLVVIGSACTLVEDVLVTESPAEVRVLVLLGQDAAVEACEDEGLWLHVDIDLGAPLGDRTLLDLAG